MMDSDLSALYRDIIIDHNKSPRHFGSLPPPRKEADGYNPLCGDRLTVYLKCPEDCIKDVSFEGRGCAISVASASLMTESIRGLTANQTKKLIKDVLALLTGADEAPEPQMMGKLGALAGVRDYPSRVKCATLAWHTLQTALDGGHETSTE